MDKIDKGAIVHFPLQSIHVTGVLGFDERALNESVLEVFAFGMNSAGYQVFVLSVVVVAKESLLAGYSQLPDEPCGISEHKSLPKLLLE